MDVAFKQEALTPEGHLYNCVYSWGYDYSDGNFYDNVLPLSTSTMDKGYYMQ